jgi:hypothetical protein
MVRIAHPKKSSVKKSGKRSFFISFFLLCAFVGTVVYLFLGPSFFLRKPEKPLEQIARPEPFQENNSSTIPSEFRNAPLSDFNRSIIKKISDSIQKTFLFSQL